jgi:predicted DCC family thiol-disulfide oxidoreductase YuxK
VNTEITDTEKIQGWVLFDGDCSFCTAFAQRFGPLLRRHHFELAPLQTPWVKRRLAMTDEELLTEMRLLTSEGALYGGADALIALSRRVWWTLPLFWLARIPLVRAGLRSAYRQVARRRHCLGGACVVGSQVVYLLAAWKGGTP